MLTFYCPNCWAIVKDNEPNCPNCGYQLEKFDDLSYEDKLIAALHHTVPERRIMAAQILGNRSSLRALKEFKKIVESSEMDYFLLRSVLLATAKIDQPERYEILKIALQHSSTLVQNLAAELIEQLSSDQTSSRWDKHTG
jgi:HEAT repeat protein